MPKLDIFLSLFPTKKNFLPAHKRREIDQPAIQILDHNFAHGEPLQNILTLREGLHIAIDHLPAQIIAKPQHLRDLPIEFLQLVPGKTQLIEPRFDQRQQRSRFLSRVMSFEAICHLKFPLRASSEFHSSDHPSARASAPSPTPRAPRPCASSPQKYRPNGPATSRPAPSSIQSPSACKAALPPASSAYKAPTPCYRETPRSSALLSTLSQSLSALHPNFPRVRPTCNRGNSAPPQSPAPFRALCENVLPPGRCPSRVRLPTRAGNKTAHSIYPAHFVSRSIRRSLISPALLNIFPCSRAPRRDKNRARNFAAEISFPPHPAISKLRRASSSLFSTPLRDTKAFRHPARASALSRNVRAHWSCDYHPAQAAQETCAEPDSSAFPRANRSTSFPPSACPFSDTYRSNARAFREFPDDPHTVFRQSPPPSSLRRRTCRNRPFVAEPTNHPALWPLLFPAPPKPASWRHQASAHRASAFCERHPPGSHKNPPAYSSVCRLHSTARRLHSFFRGPDTNRKDSHTPKSVRAISESLSDL